MRKNITKVIWVGLGLISLGIGAIGAVLPLLPTFPFLMLTLVCFAKSSEKLHKWFICTKLYKNNLESYVQKRAMTVKTKRTIMISVTLVMGFGFLMMNQVPAARVVLVCVWLFHILYFTFGVSSVKEKNRKGTVENV